MTDEPKTPEMETEDLQNGADSDQTHQEGTGEETASVDPTEALQAENTDLKDRILRTMAEMENLRRRTEKEIKDARKFAVTSFARDMLNVGDNLSRALASIPDGEKSAADGTLKSLLDGVGMTERELLNTLEKHGVKAISPEGEKFDPNFHQAMFEVPNPDVPSGMVMQVVQAGYVIGDRVLRPAMVGVSKGGPKMAPKADDGEAGQTIDKTV